MPHTILVSKDPAATSGNDQPTIQAALDGVDARGGGMVWLTGGIYILGAQLKIHSNTLLLMDPDVILVRNFSGGALYQATIVNYDGSNGNENIAIRGGTITTEGELNGKHLGFDNVTNLWIDGVRLLKIWTNWYGAFRDCCDVQISNLVIGNAVTGDMALEESGLQFAGGTRTTVVNCNIFTGDDCIALVHHALADVKPTTPLTYFTAANCTLASVYANVIKVEAVREQDGQEPDKSIGQVRFTGIVAKIGFGVGGVNDKSFGIRVVDNTTAAARLISDIAFNGITLDASENSSGTTFGFPLVVKRADRVSLTDVKIAKPAKTALIDDANDVELRDCAITEPRGSGQNCLTVASQANCTNVRVMGGLYRKAKGHGIVLGATGKTVTGFQVCDAVIDEPLADGILVVNGFDGLVASNVVKNYLDRGIYEISPSDRNLFIGNFLFSSATFPALQYSGANSEGVRNIARGKDVTDSGGFRQTIDGWFNAAALQMAQTGIELARNNFVAGTLADPAGRFRAVRAGSVTGIVVTTTGTAGSGVLTIRVFKNATGVAGAAGTDTLFNVTLVSTQTVVAITQKLGATTFQPGDEIYLVMDTSVWTGSTINIRAAVEIED